MKQKQTVGECILEFLGGTDRFVPGGTIELHVHSRLGSKASNASRVCRTLCEEGLLARCETQINGKGPHFVMYRYITTRERNELKKETNKKLF